jgi:hypothetical protein
MVFAGFAESRAVSVKLKLPTAVGVPARRPVVALSVRPPGSAEPFFVAKAYGARPPVTERFAL